MHNPELASLASIDFGGLNWSVSRPHAFGLVIHGPRDGGSDDYLHNVLLAPEHRKAFMALIAAEGLIVCKNIVTREPSYRKVRGKSSYGKLSQAEYYHHDGCRCPTKPQVVEIRLPYQEVARNVATAIAPFPEVMKAMLLALPSRLMADPEIAGFLSVFSGPVSGFPPAETWDRVQGRVTRLARREMDAESCRAYFREVDQVAGAYVYPWEMGESRLIANHADDLATTMQHRRSYQQLREHHERNGSLVKRWTAEEF